MRGKRSKQYRKLMQQYGLTFGFREPYQVLVDAQMLQDALRFKMDLVGQLGRTLHGEIKPMITQCSIRHLYALPVTSSTAADSATAPASSSPASDGPSEPAPDPVSPATKTALLSLSRTLALRRCNHHTLPSPLPAPACIASVLDPSSTGTNKHRLVLACQDERVRAWARSVRGVPSVYVRRSVMVMEPMAEGSRGEREGRERGKLRGGVRKGGDGGVGGKRKRDEGGNGDGNGGEEEGKKKKAKGRGPKEPNPLSVKKKAKQDGGAGPSGKEQSTSADNGTRSDGVLVGGAENSGEKRKRRRKHKPTGVGEGGPGETGVETKQLEAE